MVGLRVFDVGALIVWLVWFFKLRDDDDDDSGGDDFRHGDGEPDGPRLPTGPFGIDLPKPDAAPWPYRRRDHEGDRQPASSPARDPATPHPAPARRVPSER